MLHTHKDTKTHKKREIVPSELEEQAAVVEYLELLQAQGKVVVFSAVPNNTYTKSWSQKRKQVLEGVRPGVPDLIAVTPNKVLFIEMKRVEKSKLSTYQMGWLSAINNAKEVVGRVCYGAESAIQFINQNL